MNHNHSIDHLISFYDNHHLNTQSNSTLPKTTSKPTFKSKSNETTNNIPSEDCYQIDLQQWLNLGQPQQKTTPHRREPPAPRRSHSKNGQRPPIPARRQPIGRSSIDEEDDRESQGSSSRTPIHLGTFRKAIQTLWASLIRQHFHQDTIHAYYDIHNQKVRLPGPLIRSVWVRSGLAMNRLAHIWQKLDTEGSGGLNFEQFLLGTYQITKIRQDEGLWKARRGEIARLVPAARSTSVCSSASSSSSSTLLELPVDELSLVHIHDPLAPFMPFLHPNHPSKSSSLF